MNAPLAADGVSGDDGAPAVKRNQCGNEARGSCSCRDMNGADNKSLEGVETPAVRGTKSLPPGKLWGFQADRCSGVVVYCGATCCADAPRLALLYRPGMSPLEEGRLSVPSGKTCATIAEDGDDRLCLTISPGRASGFSMRWLGVKSGSMVGGLECGDERVVCSGGLWGAKRPHWQGPASPFSPGV